MVMAPAEGLHQCLCTVSRADRLPVHTSATPCREAIDGLRCCLGPKTGLGHVFACLLGSVVINLLWAGGCLLPRLRACRKGTYPEGTANFAFVEPEREYGPAPFGRHSACTIC